MEERDEQETGAADVMGAAAFVCRWRLVDGTLPMKGRHLRALGARKVHGTKISDQHIAWASQHIDWTLFEAAKGFPDAVLIVYVDEALQMGMGVSELKPLARRSANDLVRRAQASLEEARRTGVSAEDLWVVRDGVLIRSITTPSYESGTTSLVRDLAKTLGKPIQCSEYLVDEVAMRGFRPNDQVFLTSDEYGIVPASDRGGQTVDSFAKYYETLLASERKKAARAHGR